MEPKKLWNVWVFTVPDNCTSTTSIDARELTAGIDASVTQGGYSPDTTSDVRTFVKGGADRVAVKDISAEGFVDGYSKNYEKMAENGGIFATSVGEIPKQSGRTTVIAASFNQAVLQSIRDFEKFGPQANAHRLAVFDEANPLLKGDNEAAVEFIKKIEWLRSLGWNVIVTSTGGLAEQDSSVQSCTEISIHMGTTDPGDISVVAGRLGVEPSEIEHIQDLGPGEAIIKHPDMKGGPENVRVVDTDPDKLPPPVIGDRTRFLEKGTHREFHTGERQQKARWFLENHPSGLLLRGWVDMNASADVCNLDYITLRSEAAKVIKRDAAGVFADDPDILKCAVDLAVEESCRYRPDKQHVEPLEQFAERITKVTALYLEEELDEDTISERREILAAERMQNSLVTVSYNNESKEWEVVGGKYGTLQAQIEAHIIPKRFENIETYEKEIGDTINGQTAEDQLANLGIRQDETIYTVAQEMHKIDRPADQLSEEAIAELNKHIGSPEDRAGIAAAKERIEKQLGAAFSATQQAAFTHAVSQLKQRTHTLSSLRLELEQAIAARHEHCPPITEQGVFDIKNKYRLSEYNIIRTAKQLGISLNGATAQEQLAAVKRLAYEEYVNLPYRHRIDAANVVFARAATGGFILDRVVTKLGDFEQPRSNLVRAQDVAYGADSSTQGIVEELKEDPESRRWTKTFGTGLLHNDDLFVPLGTKRMLTRITNRQTVDLSKRARKRADNKS
jgi:hypothetical protein